MDYVYFSTLFRDLIFMHTVAVVLMQFQWLLLLSDPFFIPLFDEV